MPIYAYRCTRCGHALDALQKITEPALTDCPACHEPALAKQLTAAGFQLKGSGWYQTDFRNGSKPAADAKPDAKPASSEAAAATDAKPASTPDAKPEAKASAPAAGCGSSCSCH